MTTPDFLEHKVPIVKEIDQLLRDLQQCVQSEASARAALQLDGHRVARVVPNAVVIIPIIERMRDDLIRVAYALNQDESFDANKPLGVQVEGLVNQSTAMKKAAQAAQDEL